MVEDNKKGSERKYGVDGPYRNLYVYLIKGPVSDKDEADLGEAFLGNWVEDESSFLFFSEPSCDSVLKLLKKSSDLDLIDDYHFTYEQWQGGQVKPMRIENFVVVPPWVETEARDDDQKILLDPGLVFGTGLHPTTRDCLRAIITAGKHVPLGRVLDLGTGTGILALAAVRLGAEEVVAVDLNPLSVKTAQKNVELNHLGGRIRVIEGKAEDYVDVTADLAISNLHHDAVAALLETKGLRSKGRLILSGLMRSQVQDVRAQLQKYHLRVTHEWDHEMTWHTLLVQNERCNQDRLEQTPRRPQ